MKLGPLVIDNYQRCPVPLSSELNMKYGVCGGVNILAGYFGL